MNDKNPLIQALRSTKPLPPDKKPTADTIEDEIREFIPKRAPQTGLGNVKDMNHIEELLSNAVTAAHADTCRALDRVVEEARELMRRLEAAVENHKKMLQEEGQSIANKLESTIQELTRTVEWAEKQGPALRNPKMLPKPTTEKEHD